MKMVVVGRGDVFEYLLCLVFKLVWPLESYLNSVPVK